MVNRMAIVMSLCMVVGWLLVTVVAADDGTEPKWLNDYVGAEQCKDCHQEIYQAWADSPHALAYDGVFGKYPGRLQNRVKSEPHCLSCHVTALQESGDLLTGVQCEACHGPASGHITLWRNSEKEWAGEIQKEDSASLDKERRARDAALTMPTEQSCTTSHCHVKENNPCYVEFVFSEWRDKMHEVE
jgi:hypothetical protein